MICPVRTCGQETGKTGSFNKTDKAWHMWCQHCDTHHRWEYDPAAMPHKTINGETPPAQ